MNKKKNKYIFNYYVGRVHAKGINGPIHAVYAGYFVIGKGVECGEGRKKKRKM